MPIYHGDAFISITANGTFCSDFTLIQEIQYRTLRFRSPVLRFWNYDSHDTLQEAWKGIGITILYLQWTRRVLYLNPYSNQYGCSSCGTLFFCIVFRQNDIIKHALFQLSYDSNHSVSLMLTIRRQIQLSMISYEIIGHFSVNHYLKNQKRNALCGCLWNKTSTFLKVTSCALAWLIFSGSARDRPWFKIKFREAGRRQF